MTVVGPLEPLADQGRAGNVYRFVAAQADDPTSAKAMTLKTYGATEAGAEHARHEWNALVCLHRERCAVPPPYFVEPDMTAFACPVVAMDHIPGESLWSTLQETPGSQRTRLLGEFVRTLVALHRIQPSTLRGPAPEVDPLDSLGQEISEIRRDCEGLHAPGMAGVAEWIQENRRLIQAPSGKCVEDESDDCRDRRFKCGVGSAVVCVENFPRLDMGDDSLDGGACAVEALVECFLPVEKFPAGLFFERGEHAAPDVAFIADRWVCGEVVEGAGLVEAM